MESNKNLVLVGMMGSGKTLIGKLISKQTKLKFIDIDDKIEEKEKMKIAEIFKKKGEKYFRECEEEITLSCLKGEKQILSLGGGAYINTNIRKECKKSSFSFWLNWKKDIIIKRINGSKKRPLAMTLSETDLERLINERAKIYSLADFTINCDQLNKNEIANKIIKNPPQSIRRAKRLLRLSQNINLSTALEMAASQQTLLQMTNDHKEAIQALIEKRDPKYKNS